MALYVGAPLMRTGGGCRHKKQRGLKPFRRAAVLENMNNIAESQMYTDLSLLSPEQRASAEACAINEIQERLIRGVLEWHNFWVTYQDRTVLLKAWQDLGLHPMFEWRRCGDVCVVYPSNPIVGT